MRYSFIRDHRQQFRIVTMCRVLRVSASGYYAFRSRPESPRRQANRGLAAHIRAVHVRSRRTYGRRRVHAQLRAEGMCCSRNRVARLMRREGICARSKRRFRATTDSRHSFPVAENLLARDFRAAAPDRVWVSDITYLASEEGWLYLATVMDLYSRRIVGWSMDDSISRRLTLAALEMATAQRHPEPGLIHHSDRGSQYASFDYQAALQRHGMRCSMSRKGDPWDNAPKESFFHSLKCELTHDRHETCEHAKRDVFDYVEVFYNRQRLHSSLGYQTPVAFEMAAAGHA